jgi:arabinogalactan endo-1,4-beta-galactosidase
LFINLSIFPKYIAALLFIIGLILFSCKKDEGNTPIPNNKISAVDISRHPEIASYSPVFYDMNGSEKNFLTILKEVGINTIRLRLWVDPVDEHSGFNEVKQFSQNLTSYGFKTWITLHYSDTWADPGQQETPTAWQGLEIDALKDSVYQYTKKVIDEMNPDYIQIGNEINSGLLHPYGHIVNNPTQFIELMQVGISAVRENAIDTKIILHFAGLENADWFFNQVQSLDYDIIGLSYYPIWHGKSLINLKNKMALLSETHQKDILITETAYPFTLSWNDWTNNIVGLEEQLILPEYPASTQGQRQFIHDIKTLTFEINRGIGFCYWGGELIAWKGTQATNASPWENQALFDFNNIALPVLGEFAVE